MRELRSIWTIGHSKQELAKFLMLLDDAGVEAVADVRSQPFSRFSSQFNREPLRGALGEAGIQYVFLGNELGGRPPEPELYDAAGHVLYGAVAETSRFREGLNRLLEGASGFRVAIMCSEEDPTNCHRRLLITRVLVAQDVPVRHLRGDGTEASEADLAGVPEPIQPPLFGEEVSSWRSTRSVSRSTALRTSLRS